jgi:O-succinylbenzoic acid--CoA ligase
MVLARAVVAGTAAHACRADLADLPGVVRQMRGRRYLAIVPTQLSRALADPVTAATLGELDGLLVGGAPTSPELLAQARAAGIPVVTTYGMSETCGGCVYDGVPLSGVRVSLGGGDRIVIGGPTLFSGYRGRPDLTAQSLLADPVLGRGFRTQDRGRLVEDRLVVDGRVDDVVISGGLNVDLAVVERAARSWSAGRGDLVIVGIPDPDWGTAVIAVTDGDIDEPSLRAALSRSLPNHALPRRLVRLAALPRTAGGKVDRADLRAQLSKDSIRA